MPVEILHLAFTSFPADPRVRREVAALRSTGRRVAVIAVRDNGIGIRPQDKRLIFEPFRQADTPAGAHGTGLGLSLVRELVGLHGGRIWVDSAPGAGSCFTFTLPHPPDMAESTEPEALALAS